MEATNIPNDYDSARNDIPDALIKALDQFKNKAKEIRKLLHEEVKKTTQPSHIYHYTNDAGLKGIIENGTLWFSDIFSLNDPSELSHSYNNMLDIMAAKKCDDAPELKSFAEMFEGFSKDGLRKVGSHFVCSLSFKGNDLGQWRQYADDGRGYAVGFDTAALFKAFKKDSDATKQHCRIDTIALPMQYDEEMLAKINLELFESVYTLLQLLKSHSLDESKTNLYLKCLVTDLVDAIFDIAVMFKHKAYESEGEVRLMQLFLPGSVPCMKVRPRSYEHISYREFVWKEQRELILKSIVAGPAADEKKAIQFANECLKSANITTVPVTTSQIPYRSIRN